MKTPTDTELLTEFDNLLQEKNHISREITSAIEYMQKYSGVDSQADNTDEIDMLEDEQRQLAFRFGIVCDMLQERDYEYNEDHWEKQSSTEDTQP